eukprot:CAMPEP_0113994138 /NCGR_PEP_ID=MMETSP0328-20130328/10513_1 /TAXON_ID=39455 /ORGANISM="Alexandrium minutum" /LENGTH=49 /assembly_acc=CAM_ASM_000350
MSVVTRSDSFALSRASGESAPNVQSRIVGMCELRVRHGGKASAPLIATA